MVKNDVDNGNNYGNLNWAGHVERILCKLGILNLWLTRTISDI